MKICSSGEREPKLIRTIDYWEVYIANLKLRASGPGKISQILNLCIFKVCIEKNERNKGKQRLCLDNMVYSVCLKYENELIIFTFKKMF